VGDVLLVPLMLATGPATGPLRLLMASTHYRSRPHPLMRWYCYRATASGTTNATGPF
jgi:hypothetical protein